jgi:hypothetical protein
MPTHSDLPPLKSKPEPKYDVPVPRPVSAQRVMWVIVAAVALIVIAVFVFI